MAIIGLDGYINAVKQDLTWMKTGTRTLIAAFPYTVFDLAGQPGAGALNIGNTANGTVPTDVVAGYPIINSFGGGIGAISQIDFSSSVACRLLLFDRLFAAGAYAYNANVTLTSQPDFSGRVPNLNYNGLQLWIEAVTAFTGVCNVRIYYQNQDNVGKDTGVIATLALPIGRCYQIPLASGDSGIQRINQVIGSTATVGTFNVSIMRKLWQGRVRAVNDGDIHDMLRTGLRQIYDTSALYPLIAADSTAVGLPMITIQVANG